jgi:hypothetical protein
MRCANGFPEDLAIACAPSIGETDGWEHDGAVSHSDRIVLAGTSV